jgi:AraC family transcriptional regulator
MNYVEKIQDTVEYIHSNYHEDITLEDLASKIFCSKYNYLRQFHLLAGESPIEYLRKYRLNRAAYYLLETGKTNLQIALECGFNSPIVFSRQFKKAFGITPTSYKTNRLPLPKFHELNLLDKSFQAARSSFLYGPRYMEKDEFKVIGVPCRLKGELEYQNRILNKLWEKFCPQTFKMPNRINDGISYGICQYDQSINGHFYLACTEVTTIDVIPRGMVSRIVPKHKYAVFTIRCRKTEIVENYIFILNYIFKEWLPNSGYELGSAFDKIEYYDDRFKKENAQMDLYIPIF